MRQYSNHPIAELDLKKAKIVSEIGLIIPTVNIKIRPSISDVVSWIDAAILLKKRVSFDIETIGKHVRCIGLAVKASLGTIGSAREAIVIPFFSFSSSEMMSVSDDKKFISFSGTAGSSSSYWSLHDEIIVLKKIAELFADKDVQKVGQNSISFDMPIIEDEFGIEITNHYMDTMHAFHVLYSELPKSLNFLVSILTNYPNYWTGKVTENDDSEWKYCAMDAITTLDISHEIEDDLATSGCTDYYFGHIHKLAIALSAASRTGILVDVDVRRKLIEKSRIISDRLILEINEIAGRPINPNSPKQIGELLYKDMGFPVIYKKKKQTTDEEAVRKLEQRYPDEKILSKIIEYRKKTKLVSTFLDVNISEDGRMRTSFNASGTTGARPSSSQNLWKEGMNLQNIPVGKSRGVENIRHIFIAGPGNVFVKADLSQAEAMVVGEILYKLGDRTIHDKYKDPNFDIHTWATAGILNIDEKDVNKMDRERFGKLSNHSGNYCAGYKVLMKKAITEGLVGIDAAMAKSIIESRHKMIPGLRKWWKDVEKQLRRTRTLSTCLGRTRMFFGRLDDNAVIRDAVSYVPQSTVGDVCNIMFRKLHDDLDSDCKCILQVYDEVVIECPEEKTEYVVDEMRRVSHIPLYINDIPLIIPLDVSIGKNWRDTK